MKRISWLATLQTALARPKRRRHRRTKVAVIERCEDRTLLSVTSLFDVAAGELEISGDNGDIIVVASAAGEVTVNGAGIGVLAADVIELEVSGDRQGNLIDLSAVDATNFPNLVEVEIESGGGNDTVTGSEFDDEIHGGSGHDEIDGGAGDDSIKGGAGRDSLTGSAGSDVLNGNAGSDSIDGGDGDDQIAGQAGSDTLSGSAGNDSIVGAAGSDTIDGGEGSDVLSGNVGGDSLMGGAGADAMNGGTGSDSLEGGSDDDVINGGTGSDSLHGDDGDDELFGEDDDDMLSGGAGNDVMSGGAGTNLLATSSGIDTATGGITGDIDQELVAPLAAADGTVLGEVEFEQSPEDGDMEVELEIELTNAAPGTYDILLGGVTIGQITVSAGGVGKVEFSNQPDDVDELPLPVNLPAITAGTTVAIGSIASGTFAIQADSDDDSNDGPDTDDDSQEVELKAALTGATAATGKIEFESEVDDGVQESKLNVEIRNATPNTTLDVTVNGVVIGQITTDTNGRGKLKFRSQPDDSDEQLFPTDFVALVAGDVIGIGGIVSGTLVVD